MSTIPQYRSHVNRGRLTRPRESRRARRRARIARLGGGLTR